jgi:predicted HTH domain antitoxin
MKTLNINIPDSLDLNDNEVKMALASKLYETGRLSLGQAATLAGYSKQTFMELLADYGVSLINHSPDELEDDLKNAEKYSL